jgi:hypothetical protein
MRKITFLFVFVAVLAANAAVVPTNGVRNNRVTVTEDPFPDFQPILPLDVPSPDPEPIPPR